MGALPFRELLFQDPSGQGDIHLAVSWSAWLAGDGQRSYPTEVSGLPLGNRFASPERCKRCQQRFARGQVHWHTFSLLV